MVDYRKAVLTALAERPDSGAEVAKRLKLAFSNDDLTEALLRLEVSGAIKWDKAKEVWRLVAEEKAK